MYYVCTKYLAISICIFKFGLIFTNTNMIVIYHYRGSEISKCLIQHIYTSKSFS